MKRTIKTRNKLFSREVVNFILVIRLFLYIRPNKVEKNIALSKFPSMLVVLSVDFGNEVTELPGFSKRPNDQDVHEMVIIIHAVKKLLT